MLDRSYEDVVQSISLITQLDASICKTLAVASISIQEEAIAESLFRKVRAHISLTENFDEMYSADYYLNYIKDILDMGSIFERSSSLGALLNRVQDVYEILLYNRVHLIAALNNLRRDDIFNEIRDNYWLN